MWPLPELQRRVAGAVLTGDLAAAAAAVCGDGLPPEARLRVYRNHFRITLAEALGATFPATARLLGGDGFGHLARRFVDAHPPTQPCLAEYGCEFPTFLGRQPDLADVPFAADLARLEWAMNTAREAPDAPALSAVHLARLSPDQVADFRTGLHPVWRLVRSRWPVLDLWQACRPGAGEPEDFRLVPAWTELLVGRDPEGDAVTLRLSPGPSLFLRALGCGRPLGAAAAAATAREPAFDLAGTLALCLEGGVLAAPSGGRFATPPANPHPA
jgi:hypothetical protein